MAAITMRASEGDKFNVLGMPLRFLCDGPDTGGAWSLMEEEIPEGHGPPPHRHDWDEAYYVLSGTLDFVIDGKQMRFDAGDFTYLPRKKVHAFKGASVTPARVLIFAAPAHASDFFKELNREVCSLPEDLAKVPEIGARHGIEFISDSAQPATA